MRKSFLCPCPLWSVEDSCARGGDMLWSLHMRVGGIIYVLRCFHYHVLHSLCGSWRRGQRKALYMQDNLLQPLLTLLMETIVCSRLDFSGPQVHFCWPHSRRWPWAPDPDPTSGVQNHASPTRASGAGPAFLSTKNQLSVWPQPTVYVIHRLLGRRNALLPPAQKTCDRSTLHRTATRS